MSDEENQLELPDMPSKAPGRHPTHDLSDLDFWRAFTAFFPLRRAAELIGICALWRIWGVAPMFGSFSLRAVSLKLEADDLMSKSAMYRAVEDLRAFLEHYAPLAEGVSLSELIDRVGSQRASHIGEIAVESS